MHVNRRVHQANNLLLACDSDGRHTARGSHSRPHHSWEAARDSAAIGCDESHERTKDRAHFNSACSLERLTLGAALESRRSPSRCSHWGGRASSASAMSVQSLNRFAQSSEECQPSSHAERPASETGVTEVNAIGIDIISVRRQPGRRLHDKGAALSAASTCTYVRTGNWSQRIAGAHRHF